MAVNLCMFLSQHLNLSLLTNQNSFLLFFDRGKWFWERLLGLMFSHQQRFAGFMRNAVDTSIMGEKEVTTAKRFYIKWWRISWTVRNSFFIFVFISLLFLYKTCSNLLLFPPSFQIMSDHIDASTQHGAGDSPDTTAPTKHSLRVSRPHPLWVSLLTRAPFHWHFCC